MKDNNTKEPKERMIHIRLNEYMHKRVRICAAETDQTIQDWVVIAVKRELEHQEVKKRRSRD